MKTAQYAEPILVRFPAALRAELEHAAQASGVSVAAIIRDRCTPVWMPPMHQEIDLRTVTPEQLRLDPDDYTEPLVKIIYRATPAPQPEARNI